MKIDTLRDRIRRLPDRWSARWAHLPTWTEMSHYQGGSPKMVHERICRLNLETCTLDDIRNIAPFLTSWVNATCDGCHMIADSLVLFDEVTDYEDTEETVVMCEKCLSRGLSALRHGEEP
jgi:hypothetical protein